MLSITKSGHSYPVWYPFAALLVLLFLSAMLSMRSGWRRIAKKFPYREVTEHQKYRFVRMLLGSGQFPVAYGGAVRVRLSPHGLGLSVIFLLRFFHPPMFIPWSEVSRCVRDTVRFHDVTKLSIRNEASEFTFFGKSGESIYESFRSRRGNEKA